MKLIENLKRLYQNTLSTPVKGWNDLYSMNVGGSGKSKLKNGNASAQVQSYESWVYACVSKNSQTLAKHSIGLYRWVKRDGDWISEEEKDHPFLEMLRNVNPHMNEYEMKELTNIYQDLTGNSYWYVVKDRLGIPRELWVLPSQNMKVIPHPTEMISHYEMNEFGKTVRFSPDEIIHFKLPNPFSRIYGLSRIQASAYAVESNQYQKEYELALFQNQARPDGILSTDKNLQTEQVKRLADSWRAKHQGSSNAGQTAVLDNGLKYQQIGISPRELDFMMSREMTREEICAIFGTPLGKLGIVKDVNRANGDALDALYINETIAPIAIRMQEKLTEKFSVMYRDPLIHMKFNDLEVVDKEFKLKEQETDSRTYIRSINEMRSEKGLEPIDGGDKPYLPIGLVPLGESFDFNLDPDGKTIRAHKPKEKTPEKPAEVKAVEKEGTEAQEWLRFIAVVTSNEKIFTKGLAGYFAQQRKRVQANLTSMKKFSITKNNVDAILFPLGDEDERLQELAFPYLHGSVESGTILGATQIGLDAMSFEAMDANIITAVRKKAIKITRVNATTFKELREHLITGIADGESIAQLAGRVDKVYDFSEKHRAPMIARTETVGAVNSGTTLTYKEAGIEKKRWLSAQDESTRTSHLNANGQAVGIDESFILTGEHGVSEIRYPGDPEGHAHEVINCRCTLVPVIETK